MCNNGCGVQLPAFMNNNSNGCGNNGVAGASVNNGCNDYCNGYRDGYHDGYRDGSSNSGVAGASTGCRRCNYC